MTHPPDGRPSFTNPKPDQNHILRYHKPTSSLLLITSVHQPIIGTSSPSTHITPPIGPFPHRSLPSCSAYATLPASSRGALYRCGASYYAPVCTSCVTPADWPCACVTADLRNVNRMDMPAIALRHSPDAAETHFLKRVCLLRLVQKMGAVCTLVCRDEVGSGSLKED
jgi:hypothetical protein